MVVLRSETNPDRFGDISVMSQIKKEEIQWWFTETADVLDRCFGHKMKPMSEPEKRELFRLLYRGVPFLDHILKCGAPVFTSEDHFNAFRKEHRLNVCKVARELFERLEKMRFT